MKPPASILLVEDEFLIALSLESGMKKHGYDVIESVSTGEKAVEMARQQSFDLILMDIQLSGILDGIEAARQIHSFSSIPIIFMTGYSNPETLKLAESIDNLGCLIKPILIQDIKSLIDSHFNIDKSNSE